jgi:hypothetical protein
VAINNTLGVKLKGDGSDSLEAVARVL